MRDEAGAMLREALKLASESSRLIRRKLSAGFSIKTKPDGSFVTDVDLAVERLLRTGIQTRFPDHGIAGEEFPPVKPEAQFQWLIDPIDGTLSFTRGIPLFGTILGLRRRGKPLVGVIDHPALGERFSAAAGLGAFRDGRRLRLADLDKGQTVENEIIATGDRQQFLKCGRQAGFDSLMRRHPKVRVYADCYGHTLAARGCLGAMVDFGLRPWDIAATQIIIEEAGGKYVLAQTLEKPGTGTLYGIICGKPAVVDWALRFFSSGKSFMRGRK